MAGKIDVYHGKGLHEPEQIADLFDASVAGGAGERETITRATGYRADLNATRVTKRGLSTLSAVEVREALAQRSDSLPSVQ